jgi:hypothetical protein
LHMKVLSLLFLTRPCAPKQLMASSCTPLLKSTGGRRKNRMKSAAEGVPRGRENHMSALYAIHM